jgi:heme-degrading monooxygenase HmoA
MVLTILEATVAPGRAENLRAAFRNAASQVPAGFIRSHLVCSAADPERWRIETLWASRDALAAMRQAGTPAGVLMFRAAGAEATLTIYDVVATIEAPPVPAALTIRREET